jgi:hypothetical protein
MWLHGGSGLLRRPLGTTSVSYEQGTPRRRHEEQLGYSPKHRIFSLEQEGLIIIPSDRKSLDKRTFDTPDKPSFSVGEEVGDCHAFGHVGEECNCNQGDL